VKRAWGLLVVASAVAAFGLAALARVPHPPDTTRLEPARPRAAVSLTVEHGAVSPAVTTVRKGHQVQLAVLNHSGSAIRFALTGYEERVSVARIAPDSTWRTVFRADRPGDEFEWQVNGRPAGRFIVLGSHLEEGHE
jgi:hypothetical protein